MTKMKTKKHVKYLNWTDWPS